MQEKKVKLDQLDYRILYELDCDASQSFSKIGKKLHMGRDVIHYRVKRLEREGVIKRYITIINYGKLGFLGGGVYIKLQHDTPKIQWEILDYFKNDKRVWWIDSRNGSYDMGVAFWFKNVEEFKAVEEELLKKYRFYFKDIKERIYSSFSQFPRRYLTNSEEKIKPFTLTQPVEKVTDAEDDKILRILADNARATYVDIANTTELSAAQVHYKIKNLKKNKVILGARAVIDLNRLGYLWYKLDIYLDDYNAADKIRLFAAELPNLVYQYEAITGADVDLEFEVKNEDDLVEIISKIKEKFEDAIRYTEYYRFTKEHKIVYFPNI